MSLGVAPWDTTSITDYDAEFNHTMILVALNSTGLDIHTLGGRDSETYRDTLIAVAVDSDNLVETLTSGKLDGFVDKTELGLVAVCEQQGLNSSFTEPRGSEAYVFCTLSLSLFLSLSLTHEYVNDENKKSRASRSNASGTTMPA